MLSNKNKLCSLLTQYNHEKVTRNAHALNSFHKYARLLINYKIFLKSHHCLISLSLKCPLNKNLLLKFFLKSYVYYRYTVHRTAMTLATKYYQ
jgi:hypothetical protein